jgi:hypothetical protein
VTQRQGVRFLTHTLGSFAAQVRGLLGAARSRCVFCSSNTSSSSQRSWYSRINSFAGYCVWSNRSRGTAFRPTGS